ncbi:hypothetical protein SLS56_006294 [Neofusicoccum ribis]|uniref:Amidase domain-containing protein n=1 Tax=Neofusicoccum ribis TaxID=45134 RepID=A0ABR3SR21_9PEZI
MSVFSLDPNSGNPVTTAVVDEVCTDLGVSINDDEKEAYRKLLGVFHDSAVELMAMPDYIPRVNIERFPRENIYFPDSKENTHGAWAWKCSIKDKSKDKKEPGLLEGKKIVLKDNISVKDIPMLMGTDFVKGYVPNTDATVVTRLLQAGAEITGKAVCENMCHSATSHSAATGVVENPFAKGYSSGGSSSGSGVLVALGEADMSIGADQGGSAVAGTDNIDDRGFAAPTPANIPEYSLILSRAGEPKNLSGVRVGIISESLTGPVLDPRVKATFLQAAETFTQLGATVSEVSIPLHKKGPAIWTGVSKVGGYLAKSSGPFGRRGHQMVDLHGMMWPLKQENWDNAYVSSKNIYLNGAYAAKAFPQLLGKATNLSRMLRDAYDAALEENDVLITPTLPYIATSHCAPDAGPLEQIAKQVGLTCNTCQFNQTGHPALTMPVGMLEIQEGPLNGTGTKLPVGLQIVGKWWAEEIVYRIAYAWELANPDWKSL